MRALVMASALGLLAASWAQWPEVRVQDIQTVVDPSTNDDSPLLGDTIQVVGIALTDARSIYIGARWSVLIADTSGGPWSTVQIVQDDTSSAGMGASNITAVQPGFLVRYTGWVSEYPPSGDSRTQVMLLLNPIVPIQVLGIRPVPQPVVLTCQDFSTRASGEPWEANLVTIRNVTMINNNLGGYRALVQDDTGFQMTLDTWWNPMYNLLRTGQYTWPPNGSRLDVTGFIKDMANGTGNYSISPRGPQDVVVHQLAPVIADIQRDVVVPSSSTPVNVQAKIKDLDGTISQAILRYRVNAGQFQDLVMTSSPGDSIYRSTIPAQPHSSVVEFFIKAQDNAGNWSAWPDSSAYMHLYHVLDEGFGIYHVQWTPYGNGVYNSHSPYQGLTVTVRGIVMHDTIPFAGMHYFIQDSGSEPWHGIWVDDSATKPQEGDLVEVTGVVSEYYYVTRITPQNPAADVRILSRNNPPFAPVVLHTGDLNTAAGRAAEGWESMLVRVEHATVTNPFPDAPGNYGEFVVDDGTGPYRVDDLAATFDAQLDSIYQLGDTFDFLQGFQYYSFYNFKLVPRGPWDVQLAAGASQPPHVQTLRVLSVRPNPAGSSVCLTYLVPFPGQVRLGVFDLAGRQVQSVALGLHQPGVHQRTWPTLDSDGRPLASGAYVLRLTAADQEHTQRVVIVR